MSQGAAVLAVLAALEKAGAQARPRGEVWEFFCPAHADGTNRAGELRQGDKGALIVCHAGCDPQALVSALGMAMADLFDEKPAERLNWDQPDARYIYRDAAGAPLYEVRRIGQGKAKQIRPFVYEGGQWKMGLPAGRRVLYRLPEVASAIAEGFDVLVCEGEKDADAAASLGIAATTNVGGALKWKKEYNEQLAGADVIVVRDKDETGRAHARQVVENLSTVARSIRVVEALEGNDLHDHLAAGHGIEELQLCDLVAEARAPVEGPIPVVANGHGKAQLITPAPEPDQDIDSFLNDPEPDYDWVIPGLIERGDRLILTGAEGSGKSTLLRQFSIMAAAGIHPFSLESMDAISVMYVDLENSKRQVRRKLRPLRLAARDLDPTMIRIRIVTQGIDLLKPTHQEFLEERIVANKPDLLVIGPLYKLVGDDPVKEEPARVAALTLDYLRTKYGFALFMETHCPHGQGLSTNRPERPYGASLWMRWPEFGLFLDGQSGALRHWRGARDEREWPTMLQRGGPWPWTAVTDGKVVTFARMMDAVRRAGRALSVRELEMETKASKSQIQRMIEANRNQWNDLIAGLPEEEF